MMRGGHPNGRPPRVSFFGETAKFLRINFEKSIDKRRIV